jgi:4-diphosphocytidyl-2-C-methyl-D-erythritol kinase
MIFFPGCKINLGLNVLSKRPDGYHNLETCFYPVNWQDVLELVPADSYKLELSGVDLPVTGENLCTKVFNLMQQKYNIKPVHTWLHKNIPHGAGLGGGSSDAAAMIGAINELFQLKLNQTTLEALALLIGSDCPFFINPVPKIATGRGEIFEPIKFTLAGKWIVLFKPEESISTAEAYKNVEIKTPDFSIKTVLEKESIQNWRTKLSNAFEPYAFQKIPQLLTLRDLLYNQGAVYAAMSGSGSAIFGIFDQEPPRFQIPGKVAHWRGILG